jgi:hypothetical protein
MTVYYNCSRSMDIGVVLCDFVEFPSDILLREIKDLESPRAGMGMQSSGY